MYVEVNMLEIKNVVKDYGKLRALNRVNITAHSGDIIGVLGHNGSGKTTLFRLCLNLLMLSEGEIWFNKRKIVPLDIGYLPEYRAVYKDITILQQIVYLAKLKKVPKTKIDKQCEYWLKRFGLWERKDHLIASLSKGNQQKVQFICALLHNPSILILDEPLTGLDAANVELFRTVLLEQSQQGKIIFLSTHQYEELELFCNYILLLKQGNTMLQGKLDELKAQDGRVCITIPYYEDVACLKVIQEGRMYRYIFENEEQANVFLKSVKSIYVKKEPISLRELVTEVS